MVKSFKKQSYAKLKKDCLAKGTLFEDPLFPASKQSLQEDMDIEWMRPKEISKVPRLVHEGIRSDDLVCDDIHRTWFATAAMCLSLEPRLWQKVIPEYTKQEWDEKNKYAGIFKFCFWRFGAWIEVVIDDRLPVINGKLAFCRSNAKNEFWSALLEKAYAKVLGSYAAMLDGQAADTVVDFTGGVSEKIDLSSELYQDQTKKNSVFQKLKEAYENKSLMDCYMQANFQTKPLGNMKKPKSTGKNNSQNNSKEAKSPKRESRKSTASGSSKSSASGSRRSSVSAKKEYKDAGTTTSNGLVKGLGYNITMVMELTGTNLLNKIGSNNVRLIRLFGATQYTWTGPWSQKSKEMGKLNIMEWEKLGVKYEKEGEFWMSFHDFINTFTNIDICHFLNTSFFSLKKNWAESIQFSAWSGNDKSGGSDWGGNSILRNPQIMFDVTPEHDTVIVSIEQRDHKGDELGTNSSFQGIGFYITKVEQNRMYRVHIKGSVAFKSQFMESRNIFGRVELPKGRYVIIPCCKSKASVGSFMLRLFTASNASAVELLKDKPNPCGCIPKFKMVTTIEVVKVDGVAIPETAKGSIDPFVVIRCEGQKVRSDFQKNTASPVFHTKATFYRKKPDENMTVEVLSHNLLKDTFLGIATIDVPGGEDGVTKVFDLYGKNKEAEIKKPGKVHVFIRSSYDLAFL